MRLICSTVRRIICSAVVQRLSPSGCSYSQLAANESWNSLHCLMQDDLELVKDEILQSTSKLLTDNAQELKDIAAYSFLGEGKFIRPIIVLLMAGACNSDRCQKGLTGSDSRLLSQTQFTSNSLPRFSSVTRAQSINSSNVQSTSTNSKAISEHQRRIACIAEMIHTASLAHDDVIDTSPLRRGRPSIYSLFGEKKAVLVGDYILARSSILLASIGRPDIVIVLSQVIEDLVRGEFMQLGTKLEESERFDHYLTRIYKKTASLIANSCKAVAMLSSPDDKTSQENAYLFGKNAGLAFQLIDDLLDFTGNLEQLGKPATSDVKQGIATGPVLFAAQKHLELQSMIMRRFETAGDVEKAYELVLNSDGCEQTRYLAERYSEAAIKCLDNLAPSAYVSGLRTACDFLTKRIS